MNRLKKALVNFQLKVNPLKRLRKSGASIGENVFFGGNIYIELENAHLLTIKSNAVLSSYTKIILHDSSINNTLGGPIKYGKVIIGENSYIGLDSLILPGTEIGNNCIVGAGSLVKGKLKNNSVYVGRPAKRICSVSELAKRWKKKDEILLSFRKSKRWNE